MTLVHTADSLTVEIATDPRTDNRAFCMEYAIAYAMRVLTGGRQRKAKGTAPKRIADRRTGGGDGRPADLRPLDRFRLLPLSETDPRRWQEERGSRTWKEKLDSEAFDIAQDAAVLFFAARRKALDTGDDTHRIDTIGAIRFAVRDRRKATSRATRPERKRCSVCRAADGPCSDCQNRLQRARERWARANRPTALAREVSQSLSEVIGPAADSIEDVMPHHAKKHVKAVIRYIASGSTQTETAEAMGISQSTVSRILSALRETTSTADYLPTPVGTAEVKGTRIYGQGKGTTSATVGMLCDLLDTVLPHKGTAVKQTESQSAPPPFWTALKEWQLPMPLNVESGYHTFEQKEVIAPNVVSYVADYRTEDGYSMPWNTWDGMSGFQWNGSGI